MGIVGKFKRWIGLWGNQFSIKNIDNNRSDDTNTVLIIKLDAIGDFIIWLDSAKEYRGLYPRKKLTLLCNALCKEIAEATGYFDEIWTLNIRKYETDKLYRQEQDEELRKHGFGLLIQTAYSRTQHMDMLAAVIPAKKKIAFEADESKSNVSRSLVSNKNKKRLDNIYDQLIPASKENLMELQRNKEFIIGLGKKDFKSAIPKLPHTENVKIPQRPYFVVFPGASTKVKMWSAENFTEVINHIHREKSWNCIVCGGNDESYLFEKVALKVNARDRIKNYFGKTSLIELIEIVRNSELVISNDTSGIHFAAGTGVKGICPFGEYNIGRFLPYQSDEGMGSVYVCSSNEKCRNCAEKHMTIKCLVHITKYGQYLCLNKVKPDEVLNRIIKKNAYRTKA